MILDHSDLPTIQTLYDLRGNIIYRVTRTWSRSSRLTKLDENGEPTGATIELDPGVVSIVEKP